MQGMVQHMEMSQCNQPYKQTEKKKLRGHLIRCWKSLWQYPIPLFENGSTSTTPKHNKGNIQQVNSHHQIKWRETQIDSTKIPLREGHPFCVCLCNIVLKVLGIAGRQLQGDQEDTNLKGRSQTLTDCT